MMKGKLILTLLAGGLAMGGCDDLGTTSPGGDDARVSLLLTDAPGDLEAAVVTITDIYLQPGEGEDAERVYLRQGAGITTDLLTLQNRVQEIVSEQTVPEGRYEQLRLVITGGYIAVEAADGGTDIYASSPTYEGLPSDARVVGDLQMPGFATSGLKVILDGGRDEEEDGAIEVRGERTLLVDFDVSRSFGKQAGRSGRWVMHPVVKATPVENAASLTVSLSLGSSIELPTLAGSLLTLAGFEATLTPAAGGDAKSVAFADTDGDGTYEADFRYLQPGEYHVGLSGPAGLTFGTDSELPLAVTVAAGADAETSLTLTSATPE